MLQKINLAEKFGSFDELWRPRVAGAVNDVDVKLAKLKGEFIWHHHAREDELFLVVSGRLRMKLRDGEVVLGPGELLIVPAGVEHLPVADEETWVLLVEPRSTINTGNVRDARTVEKLDRV